MEKRNSKKITKQTVPFSLTKPVLHLARFQIKSNGVIISVKCETLSSQFCS